MSHATFMHKNRGDSWLLVVGSQIDNLTSNPSFGHNLYFKCPNGSCKPILDIYVARTFQWYKEMFNPLGFDPCNCSLKIWESNGTPNSQSGSSFGSVKVHSFTLAFIPELPFRPVTLQTLALVANSRLRLWHTTSTIHQSLFERIN